MWELYAIGVSHFEIQEKYYSLYIDMLGDLLKGLKSPALLSQKNGAHWFL